MYLILEGTKIWETWKAGEEIDWHWKEDPYCTFSILMYATKREAQKAVSQFQKEYPSKKYQIQELPSYALPTSIKKR